MTYRPGDVERRNPMGRIVVSWRREGCIPAHQIVCIVGFLGSIWVHALESDGRVHTVRKISVVDWKCFVRRTIAVYASRFDRAYSTGLFSGG